MVTPCSRWGRTRPTLFIIVQEYSLRLAAGTEGTGVSLLCVETGEIPFPQDLTGPSFFAGNTEYADDWVLYGMDPNGLSRTLDSLQCVCESIILNVLVKKAEWTYLTIPCTVEMAMCAARRPPGPCCEQIKLDGIPIKQFPQQLPR
jgi:hypothetical protein